MPTNNRRYVTFKVKNQLNMLHSKRKNQGMSNTPNVKVTQLLLSYFQNINII